MSNLELVYLKDIAETQTGPFGTQLHEKDYVTEGTPIVTVEHLGEISFNTQNLPLVSDADKERLIKYTLKQGDIVFSRVGSVDRCTYVSEKEDGWMFSGRCLRVRFNEKASAKYISFYFRQKFFKEMMLNISVGATMPSLNTSLMDNIPLYLPSKQIQNKVASVLSSLDSKIELNNRINAELESMAKTIYDYWFVQFDFPNENGKPYKASGGKMEWNQVLRKEIPKGWNASSIIDVTNWIGGAQPAKSTFKYEDTPGYVRFIQNRDFAGDDHLTYIPSSKGNKLCSPFDILIDKYGDAGRTRFGLSGAYNVALSKIEVLIPYATEYIRKFLENEATYTYLHNACMASTRASLNESIMENLNLPIPDVKTLELFENITKPILTLNLNNKVENKHLTYLRNWLLPMLMNGQLKVD